MLSRQFFVFLVYERQTLLTMEKIFYALVVLTVSAQAVIQWKDCCKSVYLLLFSYSALSPVISNFGIIKDN